MSSPRNLIGPQIRKLREARGWSPEILTLMMVSCGWQADIRTLQRIEAQEEPACLHDMIALSQAFEVHIFELYPPEIRTPEGIELALQIYWHDNPMWN